MCRGHAVIQAGFEPTTTRSVGGHSIQLNYWTARIPHTVAFTKNYIYSPHSRSAVCTLTTYCVWLHSDRNSISTRIHIRYQRLCVIVCATLIPLTLPSSVLPSTYMMHPQALAPCFFNVSTRMQSFTFSPVSNCTPSHPITIHTTTAALRSCIEH